MAPLEFDFGGVFTVRRGAWAACCAESALILQFSGTYEDYSRSPKIVTGRKMILGVLRPPKMSAVPFGYEMVMRFAIFVTTPCIIDVQGQE